MHQQTAPTVVDPNTAIETSQRSLIQFMSRCDSLDFQYSTQTQLRHYPLVAGGQ
jgi:hypothetical protein